MNDSRDLPHLLDRPDWHAAAQALVDGCCNLPTPDERVRFFDRICLGLGDQLYPAFLKMLCIVNEQGDLAAKQAVAKTMVHALSTGRVPSGRLHAWGGSRGGAASLGRTRSLGPIEYLCAWHAQESGVDALTPAAFDTAARAVIALISSDPQAKALYCAKLQADIDNPLDGSFTRQTRAAISALVQRWQAGATVDEIVDGLRQQLDKADEAAPTVSFGLPPGVRPSWGQR